VRIHVPVEHYLRWVNSDEVDLSDLVQGSEGLPNVVGTHVLTGSFEYGHERVGARRRVELSDGHFLAEEILEPRRGDAIDLDLLVQAAVACPTTVCGAVR
jgi:hypothetical protein